MIVVRSPLRISLGGGATDLPSYYRQHEGFLIAGAIDKYIYITLHRAFVDQFILKYSRLEQADAPEAIEHPLVREALRLVGGPLPFLEITSMADIPAGSGLGSSGSFTTALLKALHTLQNNLVTSAELAEQACRIEIDLLGEPVGKQDQYAAAFGGVTCFRFCRDNRVEACPLRVDPGVLFDLEDNLLLFFTGFRRRASAALKEQDEKSKQNDPAMLENLHFAKELGLRGKECLEAGELHGYAELMNVHWRRKKERSAQMSNGQIDRWYELGLANGALGGKVVGAGAGGFLMFYAEEKQRLRRAMREEGLREVRFRFDFEGTKVIVNG
jgi:D-glycero-alpha-D-manno-heptose-7-phosphate kinase